MEKLIINRKTWLHGDSKNSLLLRDDNKMCCLGFYAIFKGYTEDEILGFAEPAQLDDCGDKFSSLVTFSDYDNNYHPNGICYQLMHINDNSNITDKEREIRLISEFKEIDIELEFVGEY
jgi:hypothetical protein